MVCDLLVRVLIDLKIPCALMFSIQPWSTVFNKLWKGMTVRMVSFEEIGVMNHIEVIASCVRVSFIDSDCIVDELVINSQAKMAPLTVTKIGRIFIRGGRTGSVRTGIIVQLITEPLAIAPVVRQIMGVVIFLSSSKIVWFGLEFLGHQEDDNINRVE